jgi:Trk K+ transport system NAD-binding subunit
VRRVSTEGPSTTAIFLVLRKMRAPLIVLISLFAVSILGLTLVPGQVVDGRVWRMDPFEAFYFMSYTATTIGFGEIPYPFSTAQRAWVIITIYLSVVAWAYAIGSVLALLQDRGFREALGLQRFERRVRGLREPFLIIAGFGQAGEVVARSLDAIDRRLVVLDVEPARIEALDLAAFRSDVTGLCADASDPNELRRAGLDSRHCSGVIALTNDDEANLAVTMAAALLRPDVPVVCRTMDDRLISRIEAFGSPVIVDPFNLFGDELLVALRAPVTHQLTQWLTGSPGAKVPPRLDVPKHGRWVIAGYGRFGSHLAADLARHGVPVTVIDPAVPEPPPGLRIIRADATCAEGLDSAGLDDAVAFAAATDNDTTNLSLIVGASRRNPALFTIARQNDPANRPLFEALHIDTTLVPTQLVAAEVLARISDPMLWAFVQQAQQRDDDWSQPLLDRLTAACGARRPDLWTVDLTAHGAPAVAPRLASGEVTLGALLADPSDRARPLDAVPLLVRRSGDTLVAPDGDLVLRSEDRILLAGMGYDRRNLDTILCVPAAAEYVLTGDRVGASWVWRTLVDR